MRVLLMALLIACPLELRAQERPDFSGAWTLNAELTVRPGQSAGEGGPGVARRTPIGGSGAPLGSGRGPAPLGDSYGGARGNEDEMARAREAARLAMLIPDRLTIAAGRDTIVITDGEGVSQKLTTNGKPTRSSAGAIKVETKAKWEGATLVVERKFDAGVKITERYAMTATPRRLRVAAKLENSTLRGDRIRTFERVYDIRTP
jgi:hypothetical protein